MRLCGAVEIRRGGRVLEEALRGTQTRLLLAYLILNRGRPLSRDELIDAVWGDDLPRNPLAALRVLLSRLRHGIGPDVLSGRATLSLSLPEGSAVDVERLSASVDRARSLLAASKPELAWEPAHEALEIAAGGFMPGYDVAWVEDRRSLVEEERLIALECVAAAGLRLGGPRLVESERAARALIEAAPFRESGHRFLMELHAAQGNVAEALQVYDVLLRLLVDELGTTPSAEVRALHESLLREDAAAAGIPQGAQPLELPRLVARAQRGAFVGRSREIAALAERLADARTGGLRLVMLSGEPGIGKTRLAVEFAIRAHRDGAGVLYGRSFGDTVVSYEPFVAALQHYVATRPIDALRAELGRGGAELNRLLPELRERIPDLPEPIAGDPEGERYRAFEAMGELLARGSAAQPLVLILDDLHFADPGTLLLLRHLAHFREPGRLLVIGTYRATDLAQGHPLAEALVELRRDDLVETLEVGGLDEAEVAALMREWAAGDAPEELVRAVCENTAGNPLFVGELVRHMRETTALGTEGRGSRELDFRMIGVPQGVKDVIGQRIARLGETLKRALVAASVLGREFELKALERLSGIDADELAEGMERAEGAGIVAEAGGVGRYGFAHLLVREALYESLSATRRVMLHRRAGEAIEALDAGEARLPELAHHFYESLPGGEVSEKALDYLRRAGDQTLGRLAYEEAATYYRRALEALEPDADPLSRCDLLLRLGHALARTGDRASARGTYRQAATLAKTAGAPELQARAAIAFGAGYPEAGIVDEPLIAILEEALRALPERDSALRAMTLARLGQARYWLDRERAHALTGAGLAMARRVGDRRALATALASTTDWGPDELEVRTAIARELVEVAEELGDKELVLLGRHWKSTNLLESGDAEGAAAERRLADELAAELRQPYLLRFSARWKVIRAFLNGRFGEIEALASEALALADRAQVGDAAQTFGVHIALLRLEEGRVAEVIAAAEQFAGRNPRIVAWRAGLAMLHAQVGDEAAARAQLDDLAADEFRVIRRDEFWTTSLFFLSAACAALRDEARAALLHDLLAPFEDRVAIISDAACLGPVARCLGLLAQTMSRWAEAERCFERALESSERLGSPPLGAHIRADLAAMLLRRDGPGDDVRAQELLDDAARAARDLGMVQLLERVRGLRSSETGRPTRAAPHRKR